LIEGVPEKASNEIGRQNTLLNFLMRWIRDWKEANAKDQVSMIRDVVTILSFVGFPIWLTHLKAFANVDVFLGLLGIFYVLGAALVYMAILYIGNKIIFRRLNLKPGILAISVVILKVTFAIALFIPYGMLASYFWHQVILGGW
jgi:hypothetical protein